MSFESHWALAGASEIFILRINKIPSPWDFILGQLSIEWVWPSDGKLWRVKNNFYNSQMTTNTQEIELGTTEDVDDIPAYTFFLFVNSGSGGGLGQKLVSQEVLAWLWEINRISFEIPIANEKDIQLIDVYFINMRKNKAYGFKKLKSLN